MWRCGVELKCKPWSELTADERAIFVSHLFQPDSKLDKAVTGSIAGDAIAWYCRPLNQEFIEFLAERADDIGEVLAMRSLQEKSFKNRSVWRRKP